MWFSSSTDNVDSETHAGIGETNVDQSTQVAEQKTTFAGLASEARRNGVSAEWLRKCGRLGKLQIYHAGKKCLVRVGDVEKLIEATASAVAAE